MTADMLKLNMDKVKVLVLLNRSLRNLISIKKIKIDSINISTASSVRNLGAIFDSVLSSESFTNPICKSAWFNLFNISRSHRSLTTVSTFPIVVIFFRGCVSEMVVLPYYVIYYVYISGTLGLCFNYLCSVYWCSVYGICKRSDTLWPAGRVRLFADYTISLSSLCRLIWRHWTNKMLVRYMLPSVCLRLRLFS